MLLLPSSHKCGSHHAGHPAPAVNASERLKRSNNRYLVRCNEDILVNTRIHRGEGVPCVSQINRCEKLLKKLRKIVSHMTQRQLLATDAAQQNTLQNGKAKILEKIALTEKELLRLPAE
mmetsp:Transcript_66/g.123  ORF Transcript_66/g.123 Transcript_66/m.123 type:complete len:119 (-) Transcript_66:11-367(-)